MHLGLDKTRSDRSRSPPGRVPSIPSDKERRPDAPRGRLIEADGRGAHLDISVQEAVATLAESTWSFYHYQGERPRRANGDVPLACPLRVFPSSDGFAFIGLAARAQWQALLDWMAETVELGALAEGPRKVMGHACEFETSMVLALRPELVRRDQIADDPPSDDPALRGLFTAEDMYQKTDHGCVGYPERASVEKGRACLNAAIGRTCEAVSALLRRSLPR